MALKIENSGLSPVAASGAESENLADLEREADLLDAAPEVEAAASAEKNDAQVLQSTEAELLSTLETIRAMVFSLFSSVVDSQRMQALGQVWNDQVLAGSAQAGALVLAKHGIQLTDVMGKFGPYVMLLAVVAPPVLMTKKILEKQSRLRWWW